MIYLKIINATMKTKMQNVRVTFWATLGIAILLINLALERTSPITQASTAALATQTGTIVAEGTQSEAGSTDGIMIVAVVIVLIVIIPILLKRQAWKNGMQNRTAPPS